MASEQTEKKERRKKAFLALLSFQKKLEKSCGHFKTAKSWYAFLKKNLDPLLDMYKDDIPHDVYSHIVESTKAIDETAEGLSKTCYTLSGDLAKIAKSYGSTSPVGHFVLGAFLVAAIALGALVIYLSRSAVELVVKNNGCAPMRVSGSVPIKLPGISLPGEITSGNEAVIKLPPLVATIDATDRTKIVLSTLGIKVNFSLEPGITIRFDGTSLVGKQTTVHLGSLPRHEVIVSCR